MIIDLLIVLACGMAAYAALVWLANAYSLRTGWEPPQGSQESNWALRRATGIAFGGLAMAVCAAGSVLWLDSWPARLLVVGQAALMAAAGSSDLHRFHLPLPLTVTGIAIAIAATLATRAPAIVLLFGLAWAAVVILLHAWLSKGSMQLGDHIATIWIALASPFNGLLALMAGDFANVALARAKGLRGKRVAAAGAWLIFATAFIGLPPYFAWFAGLSQSVGQAPGQAPVDIDLPPAAAVATAAASEMASEPTPETMERQKRIDSALIVLTRWACDHTASVAFAEGRQNRMAAARQSAAHVARLAALAARLAPGSEAAGALEDLAAALNDYDVDGVRIISQRLAEERQRLASASTTY